MLLAAALRPAGVFALSAADELTVHSKAAQNAQKLGDFPTAVREYEIVARLLPGSAEVLSNLGIAQYFNHDTDQAIGTFRKAMVIKPALETPHLFAGLAFYRLSNLNSAVPELETAIKLNGSDSVARTWLGYSYLGQSHFEAASQQFQIASSLDPNNIDVWYSLGQACLQVGRSATAKLLSIAPDGGRAWQLAGEQFLLQNDQAHARSLFEGALERRPDLVELRSIVERMGGTPGARPVVARSKSTGEEDTFYHIAHGYEQRARESFERIVKLAPDSYRAHQVLADSYVAQQHTDDAVGEYRLVLQLKPDLQGVHESIGNLLLSVGKGSESLKEFQSELQIQPKSSTAHMNVARAMLVLGDNEGAGRLLNQALSLDRPPAEIYKLQGKIQLHRREYQAAIATLGRYVRTTADDPSAYYLLLQAYRFIGDKDAVRRTLVLYQNKSVNMKKRISVLDTLGQAHGVNMDAPTEQDYTSAVPPGR